MSDSELTFLSGLLDFYSSRAIAHASFVVAGIFGIYSILSLTTKNYMILYIPPFVALLIIDFYSFLNFSLYAEYADRIKEKLECRCKGLGITEKDRRSLSFISRLFLRVKGVFLVGTLKHVFLLLLWLTAVILPLFIRIVILYS